jgi:hypothetical protein
MQGKSTGQAGPARGISGAWGKWVLLTCCRVGHSLRRPRQPPLGYFVRHVSSFAALIHTRFSVLPGLSSRMSRQKACHGRTAGVQVSRATLAEQNAENVEACGAPYSKAPLGAEKAGNIR